MAIPVNAETRAIARRVVWFEAPETALSDTRRFMAYAFRYGTHEDVRELRRHLSDDQMREALEQAPPGIIDARSWAYWRLRFDLPAAALPARNFG
jgi:hypothetical protein